MKTLSLVLGASLLASPAFATKPTPQHPSDACKHGPVIEVLACHLEKPSRASKSVSIRHCGKSLVATISMPGMTDAPVEVASYDVKEHKPAAGVMGGSEHFTGTHFELAINWTTAIHRGGHIGHLKAQAGTEKIETEMICLRTK